MRTFLNTIFSDSFVFQLQGLYYLHSKGKMHRDIKVGQFSMFSFNKLLIQNINSEKMNRFLCTQGILVKKGQYDVCMKEEQFVELHPTKFLGISFPSHLVSTVLHCTLILRVPHLPEVALGGDFGCCLTEDRVGGRYVVQVPI